MRINFNEDPNQNHRFRVNADPDPLIITWLKFFNGGDKNSKLT